jgi:hypothetical protein
MEREPSGKKRDEGEEWGLVQAAGVVDADDGEEAINSMDLARFSKAEENRGEGVMVVGETRLVGEGVEEVESALRVGLSGD